MAAYTTIDDPEAYFQTKLYTGNGGSQSITLDGDTDMQPDLIWIKERDVAHSSSVIDSVRGVRKTLTSDENASVITESSGLSAFDSDGFSFDGAGGNHVNASSQPTVAWCWKESATAGFDIVTYTGDGSTDGRTIAHSLSAVPHFMIFKERSETRDWIVYHHKNTSAPATDYLYLNTTAATADDDGFLNDTVPTSSVFTVQRFSEVNKASQTYVGYIFSEKQGFSKFGSYIGNGNIDGDFVYTGFRPAWLMIKGPSQTQSWIMLDTKRSPHNVIGEDELLANTNEATGAASWNPNTSNAIMDILSNGFKIRTTQTTGLNTSGEPYLYMAFAEAPFVNSNGVPCNAR